MHEIAQRTALREAAVSWIELRDETGLHGMTASRMPDGNWDMTFASEDARALYRLVTRERQIELAKPANNRIFASSDALEPAELTARETPRHGKPALATALRQELLDRLAQVPEAETATPDEAKMAATAALHVLERLSTDELRRLSDETRHDPERLPKALRAKQEQIEAAIHRQASELVASRILRSRPPVNERFTADSKATRIDFWSRERPDRVAFTQTWLSLRTAEHSRAVLIGMVDRAIELGWKRLHIEGTPEFRRELWIIASARGLRVHGHSPTQGDRDAATSERHELETQQRRDAARREANTTDPTQTQAPSRVEVTPTEHLRQLARRVIADGKVPASLEERLVAALESEARAREALGRVVQPQVWDVKAPRAAEQRSPDIPRAPARTPERDR